MSTFREMIDRTLDGAKRAGITDGTEVKSLINQTYLEMSARVRPGVVSVAKTLTVDVGDYSIAIDWALSDVQAIRHLRITDSTTAQNYLLEQTSVDRILLLRQTQSTSGAAMRFYSQDGLDSIQFWPLPSSTTTQLTITYVQRPALLVADADVPVGIPVEFHDTIVLGSIARAVRIWNPNYAADYHARYMEGIREYRQWANRQGGAWMAKALVKGTRVPWGFHDNSTYYTGMK